MLYLHGFQLDSLAICLHTIHFNTSLIPGIAVRCLLIYFHVHLFTGFVQCDDSTFIFRLFIKVVEMKLV